MHEVTTLKQLTVQVTLARQSLPATRPLLVAIDGRSGAGKTTLAWQLAEQLTQEGLPVAVFHLEDLYQGWSGLAQAARTWQQLAEAVMSGRASSPDTAPRWFGWDWARSEPTGPHTFILPDQLSSGVLIAEGVGALTGAHDLGVFVEVPTDLRKARALARDGETYRPYWDMWAKQEADLLAAYASAYTGAGVRYVQQ
ncbi:hypothetical protein [Rothia nasimurium]|uniref:hypothetical protein n=1 Tax=Rothia nasimurium TaxID=85336 RepID=UPI001C5B8F88|nr:hypothetical protein [Rothia nasimurium]